MATVSRGTTQERYRFIQGNREEFGVKYLCKWLKVSRSGYYDWTKRKEPLRSIDDEKLFHRINVIYQSSRRNYGSPRVHETLKSQGVSVGKKRVSRLMRTYGLKGRVVKVTKRQPAFRIFMKQGENQGTLELLWKKPVIADAKEVSDNPRSRSAKLRAAILRTQIEY